jgi:hypothetical protein
MDQDTASKNHLALLRFGPPAEFRSATDIVSPISKLCELTGVQTAGDRTPAAPLYFDSWLFETLAIVESFRKVSDGWDGAGAAAPSRRSLDITEMMSAFLALSRPERRPTLCIDAFGRPSFATNNDHLYIHLTIDEAGALTWYAVADGTEYFSDDVVFDGKHFPDELKNLFVLGGA